MINLQKGLEDYNELRDIIKGIKDINSLVALISDNKTFDIANDLRDTDGLIDMNYKSICATIEQKDKYLSVSPIIEVWDEDKTLNFIDINIHTYSKYYIKDLNDEINISSCHPYDDQDYHYSIGKKIYRNGHFVKEVEYDTSLLLNEIDQTILALMELDEDLKPKICND